MVDTVDIQQEESSEGRSDERGIGAEMGRREDAPLITGEAEYTDDISYQGMVHVAIVRSQFARAEIADIQTGDAESQERVIDVFTGEDIVKSEHPGNITPHIAPQYATIPDRPILPTEEVRYHGEPVAAVVATNREAAYKSAKHVEVEYNELEAVTNPAEASATESSTIHHNLPNNIGLKINVGDERETQNAFDQADNILSLELENQRLHPSPIEPRAIVAHYATFSDKLSIEMTTQNPHRHQELLSTTLDLPESKIEVRAPDVGGGFGSKIHHYQEDALIAWCATQLDDPVKWQATRSEAYLSDSHGRGHYSEAELAVEDNGEISGIRVNTYADFGAYLSTDAVAPVEKYSKMLSGQYDIPAVDITVCGVFTNTAPVDAYRGAGCPEATFLIERMIKTAASELDIDPVELRRRNFIKSHEFPKEVATGHTYDSGNYDKSLRKALEILDYEERRNHHSHDKSERKQVGIGISCYVEPSGAMPGLFESGRVRIAPSGDVIVAAGTADHGQGHSSAFAQIVAEELKINHDRIKVMEGDTNKVPEGIGTFGSRSIPVGGSAVAESAESIRQKCQRIAAHHFDTDEDNIAFTDGQFYLQKDQSVSIGITDIAGLAYNNNSIPDEMNPGLEVTTYYDPENFTFTFGTHAAVVEVDTHTGAVEIEQYVAIDDCGTRINPQLVEGQIHGGVAQGIGQALYEEMQYDNGDLLTTTMQDYALPRAKDVPYIETGKTVTQSPHNPTGAKGAGESGAIGAPPAIANAVIDAIESANVQHIDMPLTSEKVWRAINRDAT